MELVKWLDKEEEMKNESPIKQFLEKYDAGTLDASKDTVLFYKSMSEAVLLSQESDDEDKQELWEEISQDIEEHDGLAYFTSIRGCEDQNTGMVMTEDEQKFCIWKGEYDPKVASELAKPVRQITYMDMDQDTGLKIIKGDPNTDADFMQGKLKVVGQIPLAVKPRFWIELFFEFIDREPEW